MADEPDNLALRLLREIRSTQDVHGSKLDRINEKQAGDLYKISSHTLGVAAHERYEALEFRRQRLDRPRPTARGES